MEFASQRIFGRRKRGRVDAGTAMADTHGIGGSLGFIGRPREMND
jgi:hypothetical protein